MFKKLPKPSSEVRVRFAPEPSGYLHIGHLKALYLNMQIIEKYGGQLILRFDNTNPVTEKDDFEIAILEDLQRLNIHISQITHTSNYFPQIEYCAQVLIEKNLAYLDNTPADQMKAERKAGTPSVCREQSIEQNLELWKLFLAGKIPEYCLRAKISMTSPNKSLRDPVIYRYSSKPFPCYDFACPIVDALEGITYALRADEYLTHKDIYQWIGKKLDLQVSYLYHFTKINMPHVVISKREIKTLINNGYLNDWNDPRLPTVRGLLKGGIIPDALKKFIYRIGDGAGAKYENWERLWTINQQLIDPVIPRYSSILENNTNLTIQGGIDDIIERPKFRGNPGLGNKRIYLSSQILIDNDDFQEIKDGEEISLLNYGNIIVDKAQQLAQFVQDGNFKTTKLKLNWLTNDPNRLVRIQLVSFDNLFKEEKPDEESIPQLNTRKEITVLTDDNISSVKVGEIFLSSKKFKQLEKVKINL